MKLSDMKGWDKLSESDRAEVEKFAGYLRLVSQAKAAGCTSAEAQQAIHPDFYGEDDGRDQRG